MVERMEEQNLKQAAEKDKLDRLLDVALAKYSAVEPRAGLEGRILANLSSQQVAAPRRLWWQWTVAVGLAGVVIVAVTVAVTLVWRARAPGLPVIANGPAIVKPSPVDSPPQTARRTAGAIEPVKRAAIRRSQAHRTALLVAAAPKLEQFPSPQPLSPEEIALARYVRNFPSDAKLVAQAQEASEREVLAKMQTLANESTESN